MSDNQILPVFCADCIKEKNCKFADKHRNKTDLWEDSILCVDYREKLGVKKDEQGQ